MKVVVSLCTSSSWKETRSVTVDLANNKLNAVVPWVYVFLCCLIITSNYL